MPPSHGGFIVAACGMRHTDVHQIVGRLYVISNIHGQAVLPEDFTNCGSYVASNDVREYLSSKKLEMPGEEMFVVYVGIYLDELFVVKM